MINTKLYPPSKKNKSPLKIGVMLDDLHPPSWISKVIKEIVSSEICNLSLVIVNNNNKNKRKTIFQRILNIASGKSSFNNYLWYAYQFLDKKKHRKKASIFDPVDIKDLIKSAEILKVKTVSKGASDYFFDKDIIKIENRNLDVVVRFGFNILKGRILYCTKFGIWSYHHGDNNFFKGGPSGFWEMYKKNPITGCVLQRLSEKLDSGDVIYRTYGSTSNYISLIENRFNLYNKCIPFVMRCLRKLYNKRTLEIEKKIKNKEKKNL